MRQGRDQERQDLNPRVYQVARGHIDGVEEAYAGCADSRQWEEGELERMSQLSVQAVGQVANNNQGLRGSWDGLRIWSPNH